MPMPCGPHDFVYVHTDIPEGMAIREWREHRARAQRESRPRRQIALRHVVAMLRKRHWLLRSGWIALRG